MIGEYHENGDKRLDGGLSQNEKQIIDDIGDMSKISAIGDGTVAGAIQLLNNKSFGQGVGICDTNESENDKVVYLPGYKLTKGGIILVRFTKGIYVVNSKPFTLNINNTGPVEVRLKDIPLHTFPVSSYWRLFGDATNIEVSFMYDGNNFNMLKPPAIMEKGFSKTNISMKANSVEMFTEDSGIDIYHSDIYTPIIVSSMWVPYGEKVVIKGWDIFRFEDTLHNMEYLEFILLNHDSSTVVTSVHFRVLYALREDFWAEYD